MAESKDEEAALPEGCYGFILSRKQTEEWGLKTGKGLLAVVESAYLDKEAIVNDIQAKAKLSPFHPLKSKIETYPEERILIVSDLQERFTSDGWVMCLTPEGRDNMLNLLHPPEEEASKEAGESKEEAEVVPDAPIEEDESIQVVEQSLIPRPYESFTMEQSEEEIVRQRTVTKRPRIQFRLRRKRREFGGKYVFNDRDVEINAADFRLRKLVGFQEQRMELDVGLQACPSVLSGYTDASSQTQWHRQIHRTVQCDGTVGWTQVDEAVRGAGLETDGPAAGAAGGATATAAGGGAGTGAGGDGGAETGAARRRRRRNSIDGKEAGAGGSSSGAGTATATATAGATTTGGGTGERPSAAAVAQFLQRVLGVTEAALSQNETLDVFAEDVGGVQEDDVAVLSTHGESSVVAVRALMDLEFSNGKAVRSLDWHPRLPSMVCVLPTRPLTLEQRVALSGRSRTYHVLLYTLSEFGAQVVLEAPLEPTMIRWNPYQPHYIAAGSTTGQVLLWDVKRATDDLVRRRGGRRSARSRRQKSASSTSGGGGAAGGHGGGGEDDGSTIRVQCDAISVPERGHTESVADLIWLPPDAHLSPRNDNLVEESGGLSFQFMTVSRDGSLCVWDTRFRERTKVKPGSKKGGGHSGFGSGGGGGKDAHSSSTSGGGIVPGAAALTAAAPTEVPWLPQFSVRLQHRSSGLPITCVSIDREDCRRPLLAGTEDGAVAPVEWLPAGLGVGQRRLMGRKPGSGAGASGTEDGGAAAAEEAAAAAAAEGAGDAGSVLWLEPDHTRPVMCIERSPLCQGLFAVLSEWRFSLWRIGLRAPVFVAPAASVPLTVLRWSPTRPSVLFVGRADGQLDVWDFIDTSLRPALTLPIIATPVGALEFQASPRFRGAPQRTQLLGVGDEKGNLHVLQVPPSLSRVGAKEETLMQTYLDREEARVDSFADRWVARAAEATELRKKEDAERNRREKAEMEQEQEKEALRAKVPEGTVVDDAFLEKHREEKRLEAEEDMYLQLRRTLCSQLGLEDDDEAGAAGGDEFAISKEAERGNGKEST